MNDEMHVSYLTDLRNLRGRYIHYANRPAAACSSRYPLQITSTINSFLNFHVCVDRASTLIAFVDTGLTRSLAIRALDALERENITS